MIVPFSPHWQLHFPNWNCFSKSTFFFFGYFCRFQPLPGPSGRRRPGIGPDGGGGEFGLGKECNGADKKAEAGD